MTNRIVVIEVLSGQRTPYDESLLDSDSSDSGPDDQPPSGVGVTELQQTMSDVHEVISSLYEISIAIRNPAPRDRLLKAAAIDVSHFEAWDLMHIEHKFPRADVKLRQRLTQASCRRRQHFRYMEKHHYKFALGLDANAPWGDAVKKVEEIVKIQPEKQTVEVGPRSVARSMPTTVATKNTQTTVATFREHDKDIYVDDSLSETSSAASEGMFEGSELQIPSPPKSALDGEPFECPYCFEMMKISGLLAWR